MASTDFDDLLKRLQVLQDENDLLKADVKRLNQQLGLESEHTANEIILENTTDIQPIITPTIQSTINNNSTSEEKIALFMSLFKGRNDIFAQRWENTKKETSGYSPACVNEWKPGICLKPKISCSDCKYKEYVPLDEKVIENHLRGRSNLVVGIYPLLVEETCHFLAVDFDDEGWEKDVSTLRGICSTFNIPIAIERSRSGKGAHAWFFFDSPVTALLARKFGSAMLTYSMNQRHEIQFKSYDRLFPNQDTMPKGGFGNLIALPLQKAVRNNNNSVFIDESFHPYQDQWAFLSSIPKISESKVNTLILKLCDGDELGLLNKDEDEVKKPWEVGKVELMADDFPNSITVTKANMLFIPKKGISQRALNQLKRLAAFKNPEFYKAQAMRLSTFGKPRIICCSEETNEYLCLPRGCEVNLVNLLHKFNIQIFWSDHTNTGSSIDVQFTGLLRGDQHIALKNLLEYENGILCGTTAFGKTVVAINLIAERKVNALILVNRISLVAQWKERIAQFVSINESLIEESKPRKKKNRNIIGQYGGGKKKLNGIVDVAVMQSLSRNGDVDSSVKKYGMVIVDECHHVSAFSFELILKNINAKYVYGLTATPTRKDGHHPIITMQCGPIRFRDDAKQQADNRPFDHYLIPRFTSFRGSKWGEKEMSITDLYAEIIEDNIRNQQIIEDVVQCHRNKRNCIILTERTAHVKWLANELRKQVPEVNSITGKMSAKETRETISRISDSPKEKPIILVATGRYIGEGFDEPRLDTLFLAMPISWKGTLQQYAGRLHRLYESKKEAVVYDYVDIHERMFEKMYHKRLAGYASIGYKAKGEISTNETGEIIFNTDNFQPVFTNDLLGATHEILIVSPFVTRNRTLQMLKNLKQSVRNQVKVTIFTRPVENNNFAGCNEFFEQLKNEGINIRTKPNIHQKFAIIDQKVIWYGSINLLSFGQSEESMMRLVNSNIAYELTKSLKEINER